MEAIQQNFDLPFAYKVHFTRQLFDKDNDLLRQIIQKDKQETGPKKILVIIDQGVYDHHPKLMKQIAGYFEANKDVMVLPQPPLLVPGGEQVKNDLNHVEKILEAVDRNGLCRQSYIIAIGGGAVLDMVGFVAGIAHRGIRHIRVPTTVLSQNDSGVGVKNGVNMFGKKNFIGTFAPPFSVINDVTFLNTLEERDWRSGIAEGIKVALIKDASFFDFISKNAEPLNTRDQATMESLIYQCAALHVNHIGQSGDPFESGSSRPLDFGHWAGHKLEQLTQYRLRHGEAVAIGIALDTTYSYLDERLDKKSWQKIMNLLQSLGFALFTPELEQHLEEPQNPDSIFKGLDEFREHLGGQLTIMLLVAIGKGIEVHEMDYSLIKQSIQLIKQYQKETIDT